VGTHAKEEAWAAGVGGERGTGQRQWKRREA
jgi:hypothetical protein